MEEFKKIVKDYYRKNKRDLPWRNTLNPYHILVSEVMLQQTQVSRVLIKYPIFISQFSTFNQLVKASTKDVLLVWQGMGYNRRALYLKRIAEIVVAQYKGQLLDNPVILDSLPGIGAATAASIAAFAFNKPTIFIETNIRRVFIHHFFKDKREVDDKQIFPIIQKTLDTKNPREWYYALMDYGSYLAKIMENPNKRSKHYSVQSQFKGSDRQIRGEILRLLLKEALSEEKLIRIIKKDPDKIKNILQDLIKEQFIKLKIKKYYVNNK